MSRGLAGGLVVCVVAAVCIANAGVMARAQQPSSSRSYVVQLAGPVLESWKAAVRAEGAELEEYVPQFAFRARMTPDAAARVRRLSFVTSVTGVRADQRLAPRLRRNGAFPYLVRVERGADPDDVETALRAAGVRVLRRGAQLMIVADSPALDRLAELDGIASIENFVPRIKHNEFGGGAIMGAGSANANGFDGSSQTIAIADTGIGFGTAATAHPDIAPSRITSIFNWMGNPDFCFEQIANDGAQDVDSGHGTHVATSALGAGGATGIGRGAAPAARLVFQAIEDYAVPSLLCSLIYGLPDGYYLVGIPDDVGDLFDQAHAAGARVHSNSWGSEVAGAYSADSANADAFLWTHRDLTVTFSAGNSGVDADGDGVVDEMSINAPGTAKNVVTVGASENDRQSHYECDPALTYTTCAAQGGQNAIFTWGSAWPERYPSNPLRDDLSAGNAEQMAAFSSRGPTSDGRIKPDVVAPGTWNASGYSAAFQEQYDGAPNPLNGLFQYDGWGFPANADYKYMGGTSMAAPLVAGGAAVVRDFYVKSRGHHPSAALVKAALINAAVDLLDEDNDGVLDNANPIPNIHEGWGRVDLVNATDASDTYFDESTGLTTGAAATHTFEVTSPGVPLKATLVWTDYPAATSAATSLVNDLDLTVTAPDGTTYAGNAFFGGWSITGGAPDRVNNVENVYVFAAAAGTWTMSVSGYNVPQGPQPFALVIDTATPGGPGLPMVRVTVDDGTAAEAGATPAVLRFTRSGDTSSALDVAYSVAGTAIAGADYVALSGSLTIPEGAADTTLSIVPVDDQIYESLETVLVAVTAAAAYRVGSPSSASVTITSDDLPPDLRVTAFTAPAAAAAGDTLNVQLTTTNIGGGSAAASRTGIFLSGDSRWQATDLYLADFEVAALAAGAFEDTATSVTLPSDLAAGTYYLVAKADWPGTLEESNETNNARPASATKVGPDLLVSSLVAPASAIAGGTISVSDTTRNQGASASAASTTTFYLSSNTSLDATDVPLGSRAVGALGGNASQTATTPLTIPVPTTDGSYYVLAKADGVGVVAEYLETNNVRSAGLLRIGADLQVTTLTAPARASAGDVIDVGEATANTGAGEAAASTTAFYWSANTTFGADDLLIGTRPVPALDAGTSHAMAVQLTIPPSAAGGIYYLFARADGPDDVAETIESNNHKRVTIAVGPDLVVSTLTVPGAVEAGGVLDVTDTTRNDGASPAPATTTVFYLSTTTSITSASILLGTRPVPPLGPAEGSHATTALTVPALVTPRRYFVIAKADHAAAASESSETNNSKATQSISVGPDLQITSTSQVSTIVRGTPFTVTDTTHNDGSAAPATLNSYYLSTNSALDASDVLLGTRTVAALAAAASESGQVVLTVPATQASGSYYIIVKADHTNAAAESIETNNTRAKALKVNP